MENHLDKEVSYFSNCMDVNHPKSINLLDWLHSGQYKKEVDIIRQTSDADIKKSLKKKLRVITKKKMPAIIFKAFGTAPIDTVNIFIDGINHEKVLPNRRHVEFQRTYDLEGEHFICFHLKQKDGNEAWSSPIWFEISSDTTQNTLIPSAR